MKILFLLHEDERLWATTAADDRDRHVVRHDAFSAFLRERGTLEASEALSSVSAATTVRRRGAEVTVTEGPFAELAEQLGGFYLADLPSIDTAIEAVALLPEYTVELRPVVDVGHL
ncbi:YciI family protein [Oerskovia sp. M15]